MPFESNDSLGSADELDYGNYGTTEGVGVPATQSGNYFSLFLFAIVGIAGLLLTYRRVVVRVVQAVRSGNPRPNLKQLVIRLAKSLSSAARRLSSTLSALPRLRTVPSVDSFEPRRNNVTLPRTESNSKLTVVVKPPDLENGEWQQNWDVSPKAPSANERFHNKSKSTDKEGDDVELGETKRTANDVSTSRSVGVFPGHEHLHPHSILHSSDDIKFLVSLVPNANKFDAWKLLYSTSRDGFSLQTLMRKCEEKKNGHQTSGPIVTLVKDDSGCVFGCFTSERWRVDKKLYGDGQSVVFTVCGEGGVGSHDAYRWDKEISKNYLFQSGSNQSISIGGGSHFALWLDNDLLNGTSGGCETFGNPRSLSKENEFKVRQVEVWGFESMRRFSVDVKSPKSSSGCARVGGPVSPTMNCNLESGRVLAAVDDTYDELLFLSLLTSSEARDSGAVSKWSAEHDDLQTYLTHYAEGDTHTLPLSTLRLCRWLKKQEEDVLSAVQNAADDSNGSTPCPEFTELVHSFDDVRIRLRAKLEKTAEAEQRMVDAFDQVLANESKGQDDKIALQNQLTLETAEREKKIKNVELNEHKVRSQLAVIVGNADDEVSKFQSDTNENDNNQNTQYEFQKVELNKQIETLTASLQKLREDNKTNEALMRKKVSDIEKKLKVKLTEYDGEVSGIQDELSAVSKTYEQLVRETQDMQKDAEQMRNEREREVNVLKRIQASMSRKRENVLDQAAAAIQLAWKTHKEQIAAEKAK